MTEKKKNKIKTWAIVGAIALCVVMLVGVFVRLGNLETTKKVATTDYSIATINSTTGKVGESRQHIVSDMFKIDGAEITLDEDATITYKVAFYDEDKEFISMTDAQTGDFDADDIAEDSVYFRVEITPAQVDGENVNVNIFNMGNYTSQISIVVNK